VPPDDPSAIRDAVNGLIAEPELRLRLGARARARAGAYTQEACVRGTLAIYQRVLGQTSSTPLAPPLRAVG
jgi:glycosyltransferase involved in cell wall biosynthesis